MSQPDRPFFAANRLPTRRSRVRRMSIEPLECRKVPGVTPKAGQCTGVVNLIDMYPTLIELCGLPENPVLAGRSFAPLLRNPNMEWNHPTLTNGCSPGFYRVYDGRFSYISHRQRGAEELYDHRKDPTEWTNLASDPEYAEIKARLKALVPTADEPRAPEDPDLTKQEDAVQ